MRQSLAALAIVEQPGDPPRWLVQWNERWQAYSLVGGHKRDDESFRDCLRREVAEELGLQDELQFRVGLHPVAGLQYRAFSASTQEETDYTHEAFLVELLADEHASVTRNPSNRWITRQEIASGRTDDGIPISDQVRRISEVVELEIRRLRLRPAGESQVAPHVHLMPTAKRKLHKDLHDQVLAELGRVFSQAEEVSVYDVLQGFQADQRHKLILAVETQSRANGATNLVFEPHIVKLGERQRVAADVEGWDRCVQGRQMSKRMFVPVRLHDEIGPADRAAVVYQDAGQWYGLLNPQEEVGMLSGAVDQAVFTQEVDVASVQRVIRQVCREMGRSFYRDAQDDTNAARAFYRSKLKLDVQPTVLDRWRNDESLLMRRDVDWLVCGMLSPASQQTPDYVDPYDYIVRALRADDIPATLVGPSHGDLHAGNVIVGTAGGEVEYPLLIDYGDMTLDNVVAWDFVKLETELKVRLMAKLYAIPSEREAIWSQVHGHHFHKLIQHWSHCDPDAMDPLVDRAQQILFAFEFERRLRESTSQLFRSPRQLRPQRVSDRTPLERAFAVLQSVRAQAAEQLGRGGGRSESWQDELNFALAVYGLNTIKFSHDAYPVYQRLFALVSAGTALAQVSSVRTHLSTAAALSSEPVDWSIYHAPLRLAYRQWQANNQLVKAEQLLASVSERFSYSVVFRREHALLKSKIGRIAEAEEIIRGIATPPGAHGETSEAELVRLCGCFLEIEVLSRLGRINKDKADAHWEKLNIDFHALKNLTPTQFYRSAYLAYRKAFELSRDYYPGGNAAVAGLLANAPDSREIAQSVADECSTIDVGSMSPIDRYWVIATEGDMSLVLGESGKAAEFFRTALEELPPGYDGMVQTTYNQLCRLYRALGGDILQPVLEVFRQTSKFKVTKGPLGDCDGLFTL